MSAFLRPSAGSDLAALRTRATRDGDDWIVSGQKIWTSHANIADFGLLLARTDTKVPKHAGLTAYFVDMRSPGIEVRPIKRISGDHSFNEVFFDNVRVPDSQRLGAVGEGWSVALTTLSHERLAIAETSGPTFADIFRLCSETRIGGKLPIDNQVVREARRLVHSGRGREVHAISCNHSAVPRAETRPRGFRCQGGERDQASGDRFACTGFDGAGSCGQRSGSDAIWRSLSGCLSVCARQTDCGRNRRDIEKHHRGTGSGLTRRSARRTATCLWMR